MSASYDLGYLPELGDPVNSRRLIRSHEDAPSDVGTLWTMRRPGHRARCALMSWAGRWELRILVDDEVLLAERCPRGGAAFEIAEVWHRRMLDQGWRQVVPNEAQ
jgi:hypothetical protein